MVYKRADHFKKIYDKLTNQENANGMRIELKLKLSRVCVKFVESIIIAATSTRQFFSEMWFLFI